MQVISIPVEDKFIIYRPLLRLAFVGNRAMADLALGSAAQTCPKGLPAGDAATFLQSIGFFEPDPAPPPEPNTTFCPNVAVLLLTNQCHLRCIYCYANGGEGRLRELPLDFAKVAIDQVCQSAADRGQRDFEVAFHGGGEPTRAWQTLTDAVAYAKTKPLPSRISLTTNGIWSKRRRDWIVDHVDELTLSMDGTRETQDRQRPFASGKGSFTSVMQTIRALDQKSFSYGIRVTATYPWREQLAADVQFICEETGCQTIQVEPAYNSARGTHQPPTHAQSGAFVDGFMTAFEIANRAKRMMYYSGARPWLLTRTFCTAPYTALVVNASGDLVACYEITDSNHPLAAQSRLGKIEGGQIRIDEKARDHLLARFAERRALCRECFCYWHCAGDCYAHAFSAKARGHEIFSQRCFVNREITARLLLWNIMQSEGVWRGYGWNASNKKRDDRLLKD